MTSYFLNVEIDADNLGEVFELIQQLPQEFSPTSEFPDWLRSYSLNGNGASVSYLHRLDVIIPEPPAPVEVPEVPEVPEDPEVAP